MSGLVKGTINGATDVAAWIAADVGNSYQDILLQDSPLSGGSELTTTDPVPDMEPADPPWPGMTGETLGPEPAFSTEPTEYPALEAGAVIDADYEELPEVPQIEHQPEIDAPDIDA